MTIALVRGLIQNQQSVGKSFTMLPFPESLAIIPVSPTMSRRAFRRQNSLNPLAMPADEGLRFDDHQCHSPVE
jgi:hypothetical protein